jgi:hypothetical protein
MVDYESGDDGPNESRSKFRSFLIRDWPYLLMLTLALFGAAFTSADRPAMMLYWMVLGPSFGIICVVAHWRDYDDPEAHWQLARKQALHWTAVMFTMYLVFEANVKQMMNADASALMVLALLALGTFTAGIQINSWRICLVGLILGLGVPAVAWLEQSTLLLLLVAVVLVTFGVLLFSHYRGAHADIKNKAKPNS